MATFKAYRNGFTMGRGNTQPVGGIRGEVVGWSRAAVRRHKAWLYSIDSDRLSGEGDAVTLTLRVTPDTYDEWAAALSRFQNRLRVMPGFVRGHWVIEWQRRGTPHVHMAVYGSESLGWKVVAAWISVMGAWGPLPKGQFVTPITGPVGWLQYLSKHASRGVAHYQRQGMPPGWKKTGRLWGKVGPWPSVPPLEGSITQEDFVRLRRVIRGYAVAEARKRALEAAETRLLVLRLTGVKMPMTAAERSAWRGVKVLRQMFKTSDRGLSASRGVSEWVPESEMLRLLDWVSAADSVQ